MSRGRAAVVLFLVALVMRVLFWQATADRHWGWSAAFKGDAPLWLEYARAIQLDRPFELGLPIHPPGNAWLVSLLWNGEPSGIAWLRLAWIILGALVPALLFLAAERSFGFRAAAIAGGFCAISTGLMLLSTSIDSETPYLVLVLASFCVERVRSPAMWAALNGIACLFRVEHLLFFVLALLFFGIRWRQMSRVLIALLFFALPLIPWHITSWSAIRRFNEEPRQLSPMEEQAVGAVERALQHMRWTPDALRRREELPGFTRRTAAAFVTATVYYRGGTDIRGEDFGILEEAFGYVPRPLQRHPFVSSYGPLNFALANHANADGGFDRLLLDQPPPLAGGASRYPSFLVQGLPPGELTFFYPPHLQLFNDGYAIGWKWIAGHPRDFARLAARKLDMFRAGATLGITGYDLPLGLSGNRGAVDLVAPDESLAATLWRTLLLALFIGGVAVAWRNPASWPWLMFLATKIVVTIFFFGYARHGAAVIPVLALFIGLLLDRINKRLAIAGAAVLLLAVAIEGARVASKPELLLDGRVIGAIDPDPPDIHRDQRLDVR